MSVLLRNIIIASACFFGVFPLLYFYKDNKAVQGVIFLLAIILYVTTELFLAGKRSAGRTALQRLNNTLFIAILFLALAFLVQEWFALVQLQIGFLMISSIYTCMSVLHFIDYWGSPLRRVDGRK